MRLFLAVTAATLVMMVGLVGCAVGLKPAVGDLQEYRDAPEVTTGSNLPRRDRSRSAAREADKDVIETSLRSTTRNTGQ